MSAAEGATGNAEATGAAPGNSTRLQGLMVGHGALVMLMGMIAGFAWTFSLLGSIDIWPLPAIDIQVPGSVRGWGAAHKGCILNGLMVLAIGVVLPRLALADRGRTWVAYGLIFTAWANTLFYFFATFAANRGLSMGGNRMGEGDIFGTLAFFPALLGAYVVMIALVITARGAFKLGRA